MQHNDTGTNGESANGVRTTSLQPQEEKTEKRKSVRKQASESDNARSAQTEAQTASNTTAGAQRHTNQQQKREGTRNKHSPLQDTGTTKRKEREEKKSVPITQTRRANTVHTTFQISESGQR